MAAIGNSAELLFKIKADSAQAVSELTKIKAETRELGTGFGTMGASAAAAVDAIKIVGAAAVGAAVGIFQLTVAASEYGSAIFDASEKTGLTAETISALKYAADTSGSSLESITNSVAKFSVLMGQAANGNEKAATTLQRYGVTATDTEAALTQAVSAIARMTNSTQQSAAAAELFKDKTGAILPVIKSFSGDLPGLIQKVKDLGISIDGNAAVAADNFGDTLDTLKTQAAGVGRQFATELMPAMTRAMAAISAAMAANKGEGAAWAKVLLDASTGVGVAFQGMTAIIRAQLSIVDSIFGTSAANAVTNANFIRNAIVNMIPLLSLLTNLGREFGAAVNADGLNASLDAAKGNLDKLPAFDVPKITSGGGGGGAGKAAKTKSGPTDEELAAQAEKERKALVDAARKAVEDTLAIYKAGYDERNALLDVALEQGAIKEIEKIRDVARIRLEAAMDEKRLNEQLLANDKIKLNEEEKADILQKIKILTIQIRIEKLKGSAEITAQIKKEIEDAEKLLEIEHERERTLKRRIKADTQADRDKELQALKDRTQQATLAGGGFGGGLFGSIGIMADNTLNARDKMAAATNGIKASWQSLKDAFAGGFDQFASGIGSIVENFVLMGATGPAAMKKLTASVLAGVAAQAAILAVFELAKGFAALFFNPAEAVAHFQSAALFGSIAIGTGLAGRAIAGDSFQQSAGGSGAAASSNSQSQNNNFQSGQFGGFGQRLNNTLAAVEETTNRLANKIESFRPGDVLGMGVEQNPNAVSDGLISGLQNNSRLTGMLKRATGDAR